MRMEGLRSQKIFQGTVSASNISNIIISAVIVMIGIFVYLNLRLPVLSISPDPPSFSFNTATGPEYQTLYVSNTGGGTLWWSVSADQPWWIKVSPERGTDSGTVAISVVSVGLIPGEYRGTITVTSNGGVRTGSVYLNVAPAQITDGTSIAERKTLAVGEIWYIGDGWAIQVMSIDAKATPKQIWLSLSRNGNKLDDKVLSEGETYNYENILSVKISSIYPGASSDMATLTDVKYQKDR
jgi:hypothetical protein